MAGREHEYTYEPKEITMEKCPECGSGLVKVLVRGNPFPAHDEDIYEREHKMCFCGYGVVR